MTLHFLPSYSSNLNLIAWSWKFVKKKCLNNVDDATFDEFTSGINDDLGRIETDYKAELAALVQPNFQDLKNSN